jgi:hypothetical protein
LTSRFFLSGVFARFFGLFTFTVCESTVSPSGGSVFTAAPALRSATLCQ